LRLADKTVHWFLISLGITFITVAIPIATKENWITILWITEAAALSYIGFKAKRQLYLHLTVILIALAAISLIIDWNQHYFLLQNPVVQKQKLTTRF